MSEESRSVVHVELYVRSLAPRGLRDRQAVVVDALEKLADREAISEYTVHVCGEALPATPAETVTDFGTYLLNRVAVFQKWADENDYSLGSLFEHRTVNSTLLGETRERVVLPVMALAEYKGPDLRFVAPCRTTDGHVTVQERLDQLRDEVGVEAIPLRNAHASPPSSVPLIE